MSIGDTQSSNHEPLLEVRNLNKSFGGLQAVNDVSMSIEAGQIVSIIGPNGAGKTTFFNCLTKFETPDSGQIFFEGVDITKYRTHEINAAGISRTFQQIRLFLDLTILENILIGMHSRLKANLIGALLRPRSVVKEEELAVARVKEILGLFQNRLLPRLHEKASVLSYANRRRVEIARALASQPRLLLLDEPAAGMNPHETELVKELISHLKSLGYTVVLIEHDMRVVMTISDKVVVLDHGAKIAEGTPEEIQNNDEVMEAYMGRKVSDA